MLFIRLFECVLAAKSRFKDFSLKAVLGGCIFQTHNLLPVWKGTAASQGILYGKD